MTKFLAASLAVILAAAAPASALEWNAMGPRAMGMGGAGVADARGPLAAYWNPAALSIAEQNSYGLQIPFGVHAALTGTVVEGAKNLKNTYDACSSGAGCTDAQVKDALGKLSDPNDGLRVNAASGGDFRIGKLAFFANGFLDMGATPSVDLVHNTAATVTQNTSSLVLKGARVLEFGVGYGHELPWAKGVSVGGNFKLMNAQVGYANYQIVNNNNNSDNIVSDLKNGARTSSNFGVDLGALWDVEKTFDGAIWSPRVGLTGRNLNNPKFKQPDSAVAAGLVNKFAVNPQVRLGGAVSPFNWWHLVSDLDLTNNITPIDGIKSRQFGLGSEFDVFNRSWINIPLRVGLARNLSTPSTMLTGGAGLNFLHFMVDASVQASPQSITTQSQGKSTKIPRELGAGIQLAFLFGGEDKADRARPSSDDQVAPSKPAPAPATKADAKQLPPSQADQVRQHAADAQKQLDQQTAPAAKP